jgi:hypothetical protein
MTMRTTPANRLLLEIFNPFLAALWNCAVRGPKVMEDADALARPSQQPDRLAAALRYCLAGTGLILPSRGKRGPHPDLPFLKETDLQRHAKR